MDQVNGGVVPLLERDHELARLAPLLADLERGRSSVAVVTGLPGTGRTSVLGQAIAMAGRRQVRVLSARGSLTESELPFGIVSQLAAAAGDPADVRRLGAGVDAGVPGEAAAQRLCGRFLAFARERPLLLVLDDVQLIDEWSKSWLLAMLRRLWHAPLLVLVAGAGTTLPFDELESAEPWQSSGLHWDSLHIIRLKPLTRDAVAEMLCVNGFPTDAWFVDEFHSATDGLPGLVRAVLDRHSQGANLPADLDRLTTEAMRDPIFALLGALPSELLRPLRELAVAGDVLDPEQLRVLAGPRAVPSGRAWRLLAGSGLVRQHGRQRSIDPRVATWVLAGMDPDERADLYRAAAELGNRYAVPDAGIATLLLGARPVGGRRWAVEALRTAAAQARARGDQETAARFYQRALDEPMRDAARAELRIELAAVDATRAVHTGELRLTQVALDAHGETTGSRLAAADLMLVRGAPEPAARVLTAVQRSSAVTELELSRLSALYWLADGSGRGSAAAGIPAVPRGDPADPGQAGVAAWLATVEGKDVRRARRLARLALAGGRGSSRAETLALLAPRIAAARTLSITDDPLEAMAALDAILHDARRRGARSAAAVALLARARLNLRRGRTAAAEADSAAALDGFPLAEWHPSMAGSMRAFRLLLQLARGDLSGAARAAVADSAERPGQCAQTLFAQGILELATERPEPALHCFQECGRRLLSRGWVNPALLPWRSLAAVAHHLIGDEPLAERMIAREWELANAWGTRTTVGLTHLWAGVATRSADACFRLTRAVHALQQSPSRVWYVKALIQLARAQLDAGQCAGVAGNLREAARLARAYRLGAMLADAQELTDRLASHPRARPSPQRADRKMKALSATSARVVDLVLSGVSNEHIAQALSVGKRAVELRLTRIYRHFDVTGRAELRDLLAQSEEEHRTPC